MAVFVIYTYQFAPITEPAQLSLFPEDDSVNPLESLKKKQELLDEFIPEKGFFDLYRKKYKKTKKGNDRPIPRPDKEIEVTYESMVFWKHRDITLLRVANKRKKRYESKFEVFTLEDSPSCSVIIDNRKDYQQIAIQCNSKSFGSTDTVAEILEHSINKYLRSKRITISIRARYTKNEFYSTFEKYRERIRSIQFFFSYPNLPALTSVVKQTLNKVAEGTNSNPTLELRPLEGQLMSFDSQNPLLAGIIDDCVNSGNMIVIKTDAETIHCCQKNAYVKDEIEDRYLVKGDDLFSTNFDAIMLFLKRNAL